MRTIYGEIVVRYKNLISRKLVWICRLQNNDHFVAASAYEVNAVNYMPTTYPLCMTTARCLMITLSQLHVPSGYNEAKGGNIWNMCCGVGRTKRQVNTVCHPWPISCKEFDAVTLIWLYITAFILCHHRQGWESIVSRQHGREEVQKTYYGFLLDKSVPE